MSQHVLSLLVEDKPGLLTRVAGLFARRGFNITSLAVGPTEIEGLSRITVVVDVDELPLEQVTKQLNKLINVVEIRELAPSDAVSRELMLVTVSADAGHRKELLALIEEWRAYVLAENSEQIMLSFSARTSRLDEFEECLRPFGIAEIQRTGRVALPALD